MDEPVDIWCGPDDPPRPFNRRRTIRLNSVPQFNNVHVKIENIARKLAQNLPLVVLDLIEIASYVYAGDQTVTRGGKTLPKDGQDWRREFQYYIPVRYPRLWQDDETKKILIKTLQFLSDDFYEFHFRKATRTAVPAQYFDFDDGKPWFDADRVLLFSGGLDSLAGLIEAVKTGTDRIILVSHRPAPQTDNLQKNLLADFVQLTESKRRLLHVPVWINKGEDLTKDTHQRTRSFLYASLAGSLAHLHNLKQAYFYENGITSSNLAIAPSVLGSRASRTTHPRALMGFSLLFSTLFECDFSFENPFFWKTKADVVKTILDCGAASLIRHTSSCSHVRTADPPGRHCGVCSQCVGRRLAILANSAENDDPADSYRIKLPLDPITKDTERAMVELIIKTAREFDRADSSSFCYDFADAMGLVTFLGMKSDDAANRLFDLHKRHGQQVRGVLEQIVASSRGIIVQGEVQADSLLSMVVRQTSEEVAMPEKPPKMKLPEGTRWEDITIEVVSNDSVRIRAGQKTEIYTYQDMGFRDLRKKDLPTQQWQLLLAFAETGGQITWSTPVAKKKLYKPVQVLKRQLRRLFGIKGSPIRSYQRGTGYVTVFVIRDLRFGKR